MEVLYLNWCLYNKKTSLIHWISKRIGTINNTAKGKLLLEFPFSWFSISNKMFQNINEKFVTFTNVRVNAVHPLLPNFLLYSHAGYLSWGFLSFLLQLDAFCYCNCTCACFQNKLVQKYVAWIKNFSNPADGIRVTNRHWDILAALQLWCPSAWCRMYKTDYYTIHDTEV